MYFYRISILVWALLLISLVFSVIGVARAETQTPILNIEKIKDVLPSPDATKEKDIPTIVIEEKDHTDVQDPDSLEKAKAVKKTPANELTDLTKFFLLQKNPFQNITTTVNDWVSGGRSLASGFLTEAYTKTESSNMKIIYQNARNKLGQTTFTWPNPGFEFTLCGATTLAYTYVNTSVVYICRRVIEGTSWQSNELAQIMIHEAAHTIGYANECDASVIEVSAMRYSSVGLRFRNGYLEKCGIQ